jgi:hypothetical protein
MRRVCRCNRVQLYQDNQHCLIIIPTLNMVKNYLDLLFAMEMEYLDTVQFTWCLGDWKANICSTFRIFNDMLNFFSSSCIAFFSYSLYVYRLY